MSSVAAVLGRLELAVALAEDIASPPEHAEAVTQLNRAQSRGFLGDSVVLAIAGGTGSGKSSLLNAIAEQPIAPVGVLRPTTDHPLAWMPATPAPEVVDLLDRLGVGERVTQERFDGLTLIDLPDHDSIVAEHRGIVERMLPDVDGVIWVLDPQKYRDPVIHEGYLEPLAEYQDQFIFVLNQVDTLPEIEVDAVTDDLVRSLKADGIDAPEVFRVAAAPASGPPRSVDRLSRYLGDRLDAKSVAAGKLLADMRNAGRALQRACGLETGAPLGFDERWTRLRQGLAADMVPADDDTPALGFEGALGRLDQFVTDLSVATGAHFGRRLRQDFSIDRLAVELRAATKTAGLSPSTEGLHRREWSGLRRGLYQFWFGPTETQPPAADPARRRLDEELDGRVGSPLREELWRRSELGASLAALEVEALQAQRARRR